MLYDTLDSYVYMICLCVFDPITAVCHGVHTQLCDGRFSGYADIVIKGA